jgi:hypothetical protein
MGTGQIRMSGGGGISGNVYFNGNVGIGTNAPTGTLHVYGINGTGTAILDRPGTGVVNTITGKIQFNNGGAEMASISSGLNVGGIANNGDLRFHTRLDLNNYVERMIIDRSGQVGIGTSSPSVALDVAGSARIMDNIQMGTSTNSYRRFTVGGGNSFGYLYGAYNQLGDGIHMGYNAYNDNASWKLNSTGFGSGTSRISMGYGYIGLYTAPEGSDPPTTLGLYQNSSGKVGIGTTAPAATLDVNGTVKITGQITIPSISNNYTSGPAGFLSVTSTGQLVNYKMVSSTLSNIGGSGSQNIDVTTLLPNVGTYIVTCSGGGSSNIYHFILARSNTGLTIPLMLLTTTVDSYSVAPTVSGFNLQWQYRILPVSSWYYEYRIMPFVIGNLYF